MESRKPLAMLVEGRRLFQPPQSGPSTLGPFLEGVDKGDIPTRKSAGDTTFQPTRKQRAGHPRFPSRTLGVMENLAEEHIEPVLTKSLFSIILRLH
jgi:hypothetical protein